MFIEDTICMTKAHTYSLINPSGHNIDISALPSPDGDSSISNIIIAFEGNDEKDDFSMIMDYLDALELMSGLLYATNEVETYEFKSRLGISESCEYVIEYSLIDDGKAINIDYYQKGNHGDCSSTKIDNAIVKELASTIIKVSDEEAKYHEADVRLNKILTKAKDDMKNERVNKLYFEIYNDNPELYSNAWNNVIKIYKINLITPDGDVLYSFLRYMHLTGVIGIDYQAYGKDFLGCPFTYSDELLELGKEFIQRKQNELKDYVDKKSGNK